VKEILVSCGATDPGNATVAVLDSLDDVVDDIAVTVVLSSRAPHADAVRKRLRGKARLLLDVENMAELMTNADLAIGTAGATSFERAILGLPSIIMIGADNQRGLAHLIESAGAALCGGDIDLEFGERLGSAVQELIKNDEARVRMTRAAMGLVDGQGPRRIAEVVLSILCTGCI
jgi:spore coat polysaccharide biosynthesis predicted glycosyltransferase SpsG